MLADTPYPSGYTVLYEEAQFGTKYNYLTLLRMRNASMLFLRVLGEARGLA